MEKSSRIPCIQETNFHLSKSLLCIQRWWKMKWRLVCSSTLDNMRINVPCRKTKTEKKAFSLARSHCNVRYAHNNSNSNIVDRRENEIHPSVRGHFLVIYLSDIQHLSTDKTHVLFCLKSSIKIATYNVSDVVIQVVCSRQQTHAET